VATPQQLVKWWGIAVSAFLVIVGMLGLFTESIGPLPTNRVHALGTNLAVGLVGFAFARFDAEDVFVLLVGIGMLVLAVLGFLPQTQPWLYTTLHMNRAESVFEAISGVVSLTLWLNARRAPSF
jgi:hypothetical protein